MIKQTRKLTLTDRMVEKLGRLIVDIDELEKEHLYYSEIISNTEIEIKKILGTEDTATLDRLKKLHTKCLYRLIAIERLIDKNNKDAENLRESIKTEYLRETLEFRLKEGFDD